MQLKGFDLGNCWYFDQTLWEMLNIWRFLLEKLRCIWLQIEEFTEVFFFLLQVKLVVLPWVLWCLDQSLPQLSRRWLGYVRFCFKKPSPHIPSSPHPAATNVSILFSWIVACTELMLSRHIFWLRICEKKIVFFHFWYKLIYITTLPKI